MISDVVDSFEDSPSYRNLLLLVIGTNMGSSDILKLNYVLDSNEIKCSLLSGGDPPQRNSKKVEPGGGPPERICTEAYYFLIRPSLDCSIPRYCDSYLYMNEEEEFEIPEGDLSVPQKTRVTKYFNSLKGQNYIPYSYLLPCYELLLSSSSREDLRFCLKRTYQYPFTDFFKFYSRSESDPIFLNYFQFKIINGPFISPRFSNVDDLLASIFYRFLNESS